ncbi:MAG: T9SS type A sorting domain-containing protein [Saprospiraceae bacterium]|nr:T9SS type A sorting domain-containing protein [Saprospiraceae bacterium]
MKRHRHRFYRLLAQYNRYRRKLSRIELGLSGYKRRDMLVRRLRRLQERLLAIKQAGKIAGLTATFVGGFMLASPNLATGQNLVLKTDNVLRLAHLENSAKPAFADIDGDGDLDLFVGGKISTFLDSTAVGINYYRNDNGQFYEQASPFPADLGTGTELADSARISPAFVDIDSDGDLDAFAGLNSGFVLYYRNDDGAFTLVNGAENPFNGIKIGDSTNASPTFVDVDGDGDMDAVFGKYSGGLSYFRNDDGVFTDLSGDSADPFVDINVTESATPAFIDWDDDGDMDLFVGNKLGEIAYFENVEGVFTPVDDMNNPFSDIILEYNVAPAFADIDGDGDMDAFVGQGDGDIVYLRNDDGAFTKVNRNTIGIPDLGDFGDNLNHGFVDIDADGDPDLFSGDFGGGLRHYVNTNGIYEEASVNPLDTNLVWVDYLSAPAFADIDGDGDQDAFVGSYLENILYLSNDGGTFSAVTGEGDPFNGIDAGADENVAFIDLDGDGDLDAFIGNKAGEVKYFVNTDGVFAEAPEENPFGAVSFEVAGQPNHPVKPAFADLDGDDDMDAVFGLIDGKIRTFRNDGDNARSAVVFTELAGAENPFDGLDFGRASAPRFADIDSDGDVDMIVSNAGGHTFHFDNESGTTSAQDFSYSHETNVFPNPTEGSLHLEMPWSTQQSVISVYSATGQLMQRINTANQVADLSLMKYTPGLYIIKIVGSEGAATKKVWKH